jgi:membrane protein DedA with SNARE-associated domain
MLEQFYEGIVHLFGTINYTAVFIMMTIEASVIPFPSEIPMLAVGIQSASWDMHPLVGLLVALAGVTVGTTFNYFLGYYIWDAFIEKYGKYFFIKKSAYHKAQKLFIEDANFYTFFGRLIPVVRQLISIPAGMARMNYWKFLGLSLAWSALWLIILIILGYIFGRNQELIKEYLSVITLSIVFLTGILWYWRHGKK